ncbi:MAG: AraC family transcriptional regulator [Kiritimatiellaeota bacterium]|nr:AraC family transcriptional regulator [Kiritimatiellota bacterium]
MSELKCNSGKVVVSERFRTPSSFELRLGLWVDRVGAGVNRDTGNPPSHRKLGLFGAVCVTRGRGLFHSSVSGESRVEAGDVMLLFPEIPSTYHPISEWETEWVVWGGGEGATLASVGLPGPAEPVIRGCAEAVLTARFGLLRLIGGETSFDVLARKSLLLEMIVELTRPTRESMGKRSVLMIEKAVAHIDSNIGNDLSVGEVAAGCGYSETHFRRLFRQGKGMSPKQFIISRKISRAKECLAAGMTVKETAEATGFKNEFYFRSAFKRTAGSTPGEFAASLMTKS